MARLIQPQSRTAGLPPGTVVPIGARTDQPTRMSVISYDETSCEETDLASREACPAIRPPPQVTWINVVGIGDAEALSQLGQCLSLHPLVIEDIANTDQRVKVDDYGDYLYIVARMVDWDDEAREVTSEQVSIIVGANWVVSVQEAPPDPFQPIRQRLRENKARARKMGADYIAYALLDTIVDNYFQALEQLADRIESLEDELVVNPTQEILQEIHRLKREMIVFRRAAWPMREVLGSLERHDSPLIGSEVDAYLRDVYDHTVQVIDTIETFRDMLSGMLDIYLSSVSNRLNAVMKVLTIIATIFIPLTFLAGVYGMNFRHFPEITWQWGYLAFWVVCVIVAGWMLLVFHRRRWI
jgi:magnesium transporter